MGATRVFRHQDYELQCSATPVDGGKFAPALVVSRQVWPSRPRVIALLRGNHFSEETAIDAAYTQGLEWIRVYG
jgi:hypothetical protein